MGRFSFDNSVLVVPFLIAPCRVSSGKDLADLIFNCLKKGAKFERLTSVATDGATNMVGKYNGMSTIINGLVERHC